MIKNPNDKKKDKEKIFVGVSWPYANGNIHIGHLAGQYVVSDVFARFHRLKGNEVLMVSGSDSHGAPVVFKAEQLSITPKQLAIQSHKQITETYNKLGFLYENYTSTTTDIHKEVSQNVFSVLKENGYLEIKSSKQYYDTKVERFLPDRYVKGTCPVCGNSEARGDECPECGTYLEPEELIDPYSTLSDATPQLKETKHFYLDLTALQSELENWSGESSVNWRKWVREFSLGWLNQGLEPRPVTRDMGYGIPVPVDGWDKKVLYVWFEAVIGYLSAAIEWAHIQGEPSKWEGFWKDPNAKHFYFVAGGNVPFHTILWPAELIAYSEKYEDKEKFKKFKLPGESLNQKLELPFDVPANNMLFYRGKKMSKGDSSGVTVEKAIDMFGPDPLRYFFVKYAPENHDREFIWKDLIEANNNELVGNLGNFIYRALSFTYSRFDGKVPEGEMNEDVQKAIDKAFEDVANSIGSREFVKSIESVLELGKFGNKYFNDEQPWISIKKDPEVAKNTLYNSIQLVNALRLLLRPFTPFSAEAIRKQLQLDREFDPNLELKTKGKVSKFEDNWFFKDIIPGHAIAQPKVVFEKFEYSKELEKEDNPECESKKVLKSLRFIKEKSLEDIPTRWKVYNVNRCNKLLPHQRKELQTKLDKHINGLDENWRDEPKFSGYKALHSQYCSLNDQPGSSELLIEKVLKEKQFPKVNGFVDIYNFVSIITGVSIGAHDLLLVKGNPKMSVLKKDVTFREIGSGDISVAKKGEYSYVDEKGILCRLDIKQSQRTRVNEKSQNILVIFQGHDHLRDDDLKKAEKELDSLLKKFGYLD